MENSTLAKAKQEYILTLDISSSCTGFCFGDRNEPIKYGKYVPPKKTKKAPEPTDGRKLYNYSTWLAKMINGLPHKPTIVVIESNYMNRRFVGTYAVLNQYLGVTLREIDRILGVDPIYIAPTKVKSVLNPKPGKSHDDRKLQMVKSINKLFGLNFEFHKDKTKSDDDVADAIALWVTYVRTT